MTRAKNAEILTKSWIMGVRRGWISLTNPNIQDWDDIIKAIGRLLDFARNLREQIQFVRKGPSVSIGASPEKQKIDKLFDTLVSVLRTHQRNLKNWAEIETGAAPVSDYYSMEEAQQAFSSWSKDFDGNLTTWVKNRGKPKWSTPSHRTANLLEILDKIFDLLRKDAARLKKTIDLEGMKGSTDTKDTWATTSFKEFSLGRLKVVVTDSNLTGIRVTSFVRYLDKAKQLLDKKGFGDLWYGVLLIKSDELQKLNEWEQAAYKELGYESLDATAGLFHSGKDLVEISAPPDERLVSYVVHEMGHRYWFKRMSSTQRAYFNSLVKTNPSKKPRDFPSGGETETGPKPVSPVSSYGWSSIEEAFAEAFERYVLGKGMSSDQEASFKSVLVRGKSARATPTQMQLESLDLPVPNERFERAMGLAARHMGGTYDAHKGIIQLGFTTADPTFPSQIQVLYRKFPCGFIRDEDAGMPCVSFDCIPKVKGDPRRSRAYQSFQSSAKDSKTEFGKFLVWLKTISQAVRRYRQTLEE